MGVAAIDQTKIVNKSLILLGSTERLSGIDDAGPLAASLRDLWAMAVRAHTALHPWNHAIKRAKLLPDTVAPAFGYDYRYKLPADCLRWLPWAPGEDYHFDGEEEAGYILTNDGTAIYVRYIWLNEDYSQWPPLFADTLAYTLALEHCEAKTQLRGLARDLVIARDDRLSDAKRADGLATGQRKRSRMQTTSRWGSARHRSNGVGSR